VILMTTLRSVGRFTAASLVVTLTLALTGCGNGLYPVTGRVAFEDGSPLDEGQVICEMPTDKGPVMARGNLDKTGHFRLGTLTPGDGARPGKYRVLVMPRGMTAAEASSQPPIIDRKFQKFDTSGIVYEVKQESNELNITVTKPKGKG
jgi:hypothetical protein